jgi:hypothetical protein
MPAERAPIEGRLRMTEEDVLDGLHGMMPFLRVRWIYLTIILAAAIFGASSGWLLKSPLSFLPFLGLNGFLVALSFFGPKSSARKIARALRLDEGDVTFRFDGEGVSQHAPGSTSTTAYRVIPGWREVKGAFLLTCGPNAANIVPKRAFAPGDVERVRALLAENVKPAPVPGRKGLRRMFTIWLLLIVAFFVVWQLFLEPQAQRARRPAPPRAAPR